ncbi:hypothetical protein PMI01_03360 [Caulobacter sp. AP07]|uniref:hypothetical protein n=1 Tax=Caulobacter sp. AP07 TaxID=1144304 RepID=UPI0002721B5E|nr:hypothetical protein [Caulobacter sp. AP07]EJL29350.1 hypothetical protein PMI01_03360 [Caulobacter sp. AP07]
MHDRRGLILSLAVLAAGGGALARSPEPDSGIVKGRKGGPNMIKGDPPKLDFGGGLIIPMNASIFRTLWEGEDRWITYGRALSQQKVRAMGQAETAAIGSMKLMLLTQAFAPERLERFETCGWRLKSGDTKDLVLGDIDLPGRPVMPTTDEVSGQGAAADGASVGDPTYRALTGYMVMKKDAPLDYVRKHAQLTQG